MSPDVRERPSPMLLWWAARSAGAQRLAGWRSSTGVGWKLLERDPNSFGLDVELVEAPLENVAKREIVHGGGH